MFKSYFTDCEAEVQELEQMTKQFKYELDSVSQEIKDLERLFQMNLMEPHFMKFNDEFDDFVLSYDDGKIYFSEDDRTKPLIETKYQIRMRIAKVLPDFARSMVKHHKKRLKDEGY